MNHLKLGKVGLGALTTLVIMGFATGVALAGSGSGQGGRGAGGKTQTSGDVRDGGWGCIGQNPNHRDDRLGRGPSRRRVRVGSRQRKR